MTHQDILDRVRAVVSEVLGIEPGQLTPATRLGPEFNVDSMQLVTLMIALDEEFDLELDAEGFSNPEITLDGIAEAIGGLLASAGRGE